MGTPKPLLVLVFRLFGDVVPNVPKKNEQWGRRAERGRNNAKFNTDKAARAKCPVKGGISKEAYEPADIS
ncbi:hypothetical protein Y027_253 [Burkholderia pseudomallei TSV5]|nr:hypothetical protein Y027_253 [Burkholderia pseudomallei TSV5]